MVFLRAVRAVTVFTVLGFLPACRTGAPIGIKVLSGHPGFVSGADVLLGLQVPPEVRADSIRVAIDGRDVTSTFKPAAAWTRRARHADQVGLAAGLKLGDNTVTVSWRTSSLGLTQEQSLVLRNFPETGPMISGTHEKPFLCQTEQFQLIGGQTLGPPIDANCSIKTRVDYVYRPRGGELMPWPSDGTRPADVDTTLTSDGVSVPFIVRVETGTVNRAIYQMAMLHDPATPAPDVWTRSPGWNGKLIFTHGGGCRKGWHRQGERAGAMREIYLERGYAVTSSSLNVFGQNCNDLLASETHIMLKERFVERFGRPLFTIATGGSGGSFQSHQTADNYPGVFDGLIVEESFPDVYSTNVATTVDARLLYNYFHNSAPGTVTEAQQLAITGFGVLASIEKMSVNAARVVAIGPVSGPMTGGEFSDLVPPDARYDPARNPRGARPTVFDHARQVLGTDAQGRARWPLDNVGVQYGLQALRAGIIDMALFLDLNTRVGGLDVDGQLTPTRIVADPEAARRARSTGRILWGGGGLAETAVIDFRRYADHQPDGDLHMIIHQFATRARMHRANGHHDNHVMVVRPILDRAALLQRLYGAVEPSTLQIELALDASARQELMPLFDAMDRWLTAVVAAEGQAPRADNVRRLRPAELRDHCWQGQGPEAVRIDETLARDARGRCAQLYPVYSTPRQVAGATTENDVVKCALKPIDPADYPAAATPDQLERLRAIFPGGVCDWRQPDVYQGYGGPWQALPARP